MNCIFAYNRGACAVLFLCLFFAGISIIESLIIKKYKVNKKEAAENRRTVLQLSEAAMEILLTSLHEQEGETDICQTELIRYVKDDLLECLVSGGLPVYGLIGAHPCIILKYPEIFRRMEEFTRADVKEFHERRMESWMPAERKGGQADGKADGHI